MTKHMDDRRVYDLNGHGYGQQTRDGHGGTPRLFTRALPVDRVQAATGRRVMVDLGKPGSQKSMKALALFFGAGMAPSSI